MRIVAGLYRGKALIAPPGPTTRPTSDRARESIFNILAHAPWSPGLGDARVVDLFAGSGALGLEALSRGAAFALFVEIDEAARGAIRDNVEALGLFGQTRIQRRDAANLGPLPAGVGPPFDIAFLDPPYARGLGEKALAELRDHGWLAPAATVIFERGVEETEPVSEGFEVVAERVYGAARVWFLKRL